MTFKRGVLCAREFRRVYMCVRGTKDGLGLEPNLKNGDEEDEDGRRAAVERVQIAELDLLFQANPTRAVYIFHVEIVAIPQMNPLQMHGLRQLKGATVYRAVRHDDTHRANCQTARYTLRHESISHTKR